MGLDRDGPGAQALVGGTDEAAQSRHDLLGSACAVSTFGARELASLHE